MHMPTPFLYALGHVEFNVALCWNLILRPQAIVPGHMPWSRASPCRLGFNPQTFELNQLKTYFHHMV